jgi:hypothetical protein
MLLLDELKERKRECNFKGEALARTLWRNRVVIVYGQVVRLGIE